LKASIETYAETFAQTKEVKVVKEDIVAEFHNHQRNRSFWRERFPSLLLPSSNSQLPSSVFQLQTVHFSRRDAFGVFVLSL
jgi:hypothetical protein